MAFSDTYYLADPFYSNVDISIQNLYFEFNIGDIPIGGTVGFDGGIITIEDIREEPSRREYSYMNGNSVLYNHRKVNAKISHRPENYDGLTIISSYLDRGDEWGSPFFDGKIEWEY
jgi:hypothetical protein